MTLIRNPLTRTATRRGQVLRRRIPRHCGVSAPGIFLEMSLSDASSVPRDRATVARARGVDAMVRNSVKMLAGSLVVVGTLAVPAAGAAQESVAVQCGPGQ